jgi:hypothetical protein
MNLTNEQKRKILNDAPIGMTHAMIKIGAPILTVDYAHKKDYGDRVAYMDNMGFYFELFHWDAKKLDDLQGEVSAEEVAQEAEKRRVLAGSEWQNGDKCLTPMKKKATVLGKTPRGSVAILIDGTMDDFRAYFAKDLTHPDAEEQKAVKELDEKAAELCKARCDAFGYAFDWDALPEDKKQGYRNMIKAGVVVNA